MMMRPGDILGRIFYVVTEINHRIIGSSEFRRNLNGFFLGLLRKMFWSSEDRVRARFHYAESRQNKP